MTTLADRPTKDTTGREQSPPPTRRLPSMSRGWQVLGILLAWVVLAVVFHGKQTLAIGGADQVGVQNWLADRADSLVTSTGNWFSQLTGGVSDALHAVIQWLQLLISTAAFPSPYPHIGFLGVLAVAWFVTAVIAGWRMSVLTAACFVLFALLGFYEDSMDLLIVTLLAVGLSVLIGLPLAVWMAHSARARAVITPVLDIMQTLPSFTYLLPLMLLFGIGAPAALICTLIYSLPPVMRIAAHGMQHLSATTLEATEAMGQTRWQRLLKVELPMAKRTIIVGVNQTTMAALSMATIAAFINGPGLGQPVVRALNALRVGDAFVPGLCIVLMAIMLDRVTTAASEHAEKLHRGQARSMAERRNQLLLGAGILTAVCVYASRHYTWAAKPWSSGLGDSIASGVQTVTDWISTHWIGATTAIANDFTNVVINKLQYVLAESPWFVTGLAILALAVVVGGWRAGVATLICLAGLRWLELWNDAMITLTATLVAGVVVMLLAAVFGVWMGRSRGADRVIRPILDAGQTLPPFVYLIPVLALFGATRFTAIVAAVAYAAPAAIKIVADGIKAVSTATVEAAESAGAIAIQIITKVQIPMARSSFTVAANQGLLYVLSMVVIGGLVGAGALGYDVVAGFKQLDTRGRGLAAGFSIVLLGVMLDRITTYAARRGEGEGLMDLKKLAVPLSAAAVVVAALLPGVGSSIANASAAGTSSKCGDLNLAVNNWVGYEADAFVVGQVAKQRLGCLVNYVYVDEQISWQGFASGQVDAVLENWGHPELIDLYVKKLGVAEDAGSIGITGVIGWWVPPWMKQKYPDITSWKSLNKYAKLFKTSESGGKGQLLDGDPGFVTNDEALVKNLKLDYKVVFAGSEAALIQAFRAGQEQKKPVIGYFYSPQWFLAEVPLVKVDLPPYKTGCDSNPAKVACDYPPYPLHKIVSTQFADADSTGYRLVHNFRWTADDQNLVAKYITADGMTPEDAAQKWIDDNPDKVTAWLQGTGAS